MNEIKFLVIGDPHIKSDNSEQTNLMTLEICELIKNTQPNIIVILGDILHKHEKIDLYPYHRAEKFIRSIHTCKPINSHIYLLIGNHDRPNNSIYLTDEHAFNSLKAWSNTYVIDEVKKFNYNGFNIVCVPYVHTGRFAEALSTIELATINKENPNEYLYNLNDINIIFAHQEFQGAKMNAIESKEGDYYPSNLPLCVSGHIHDYHKLQENLIYVGTPIQHGYSDSLDKTISIFTFKDFILKNHERISLNIPKKLLYTLTSQELLNFEAPINAQIKIKLVGTTEEIKNTMKLDNVKQLLSKGIKIIPTENNDKLINATVIKDIKTKTSFKDRLNNAISLEKDDIQLIYKKLFQ